MDAEQRYREILQRSPRHAKALRLLGWLHLQRGQPAQAVRAIRESLALKPDSPATHANLALALQALGQHGNAIPHFDHALMWTPDNLALRKQRFVSAWQALCTAVTRCDWWNYDRLQRLIKQEVMTDEESHWVVSETILASPVFNNHLILELARRHALKIACSIKESNAGCFTYHPPGRRLRIGCVESPRVLRRLRNLREWSHEQIQPVFP